MKYTIVTNPRSRLKCVPMERFYHMYTKYLYVFPVESNWFMATSFPLVQSFSDYVILLNIANFRGHWAFS